MAYIRANTEPVIGRRDWAARLGGLGITQCDRQLSDCLHRCRAQFRCPRVGGMGGYEANYVPVPTPTPASFYQQHGYAPAQFVVPSNSLSGVMDDALDFVNRNKELVLTAGLLLFLWAGGKKR